MGTAKRERQKVNRQARLQEMARDARRAKTKRLGLRWGVVVVAGIALLFGLVWLTGGDDKDSSATSTVASTTPVDESTIPPATPGGPTQYFPFTYGTGECAAADGSSTKPATLDAPQQCIDATKAYTATIETPDGNVVIDLDAAKVPGTVNSFVNLARFHWFDGTKVFRADASIDIVQLGASSNTDPTPYRIPDEANGFTYQSGDVVMARNALPNSGGNQFFIAGGPNVSSLDLDGRYVTFGRVTEGLDLIEKWITYADPTNPMGITTPVPVTRITITEADAPPTTESSTATSSTTSSTDATSTTAPSTESSTTTSSNS